MALGIKVVPLSYDEIDALLDLLKPADRNTAGNIKDELLRDIERTLQKAYNDEL